MFVVEAIERCSSHSTVDCVEKEHALQDSFLLGSKNQFAHELVVDSAKTYRHSGARKGVHGRAKTVKGGGVDPRHARKIDDEDALLCRS